MLSDMFIFNEPITVVQMVSACGIMIVCVAIGYQKIRIHNLERLKSLVRQAADVQNH